MKSKIYSSDHIKSVTKGQLWIPAFFSFGFLMAFVVTELLMLGNWFGSAEQLAVDDIKVLYEGLWKDRFLFTGFAVIACGAVINGVQSFWYLYSLRKTDFYHSLPVKRSGLFWQRTCTGFLYYLIPYVIMVFLAACIGALRGFFSAEIIGRAVLMFLLHSILYLLFYFSAVLVICVTGNILMGILCLVGMMLYGAALAEVIQGYRISFYRTSYSVEDGGILKFLKEYASPYALGRNLLEQYSGQDFLKMLVIVICVTAVLGVLAYLAFVKRPSESAGKPVVYEWVGVIIKFMVVVPCGLGIGLIFLMLPSADSNSRYGWWIFGMAMGTILSHGVLEVVYRMDFQKFVSKKHHLVIAGLLVAVCAVNYKMDLLKFDEYLPAREKLAAVNFDFSILIGQNDGMLIRQEDGKYRLVGALSSEEAALTGKNGVGAQTWQVLKQIVDGQNERETTDYDYASYTTLKYTLKSGREVYRRYHLTTQNLYDLYFALYEEGSLKKKNTSFLEIEPEYLESVDCEFLSGEQYRLFQEEPEKCRELLEALRADIEEASAEELLEQPCAELEMMYRLPVNGSDMADMNMENDSIWSYEYFSVFVSPAFKRTVAILKETGYPMSMDEFSLEKAVITYTGDENAMDDSAAVTYDKEEELQELKEALIPSGLQCCWIEFDSSLFVEYELSGDRGQDSYSGQLLSEKLPDFVKKMKEEAGAGQSTSDASESEELIEASRKEKRNGIL